MYQDDSMSRDQMVQAIILEIKRVFGKEGFSGTWEEYDWLLQYYQITEFEDVCWQYIVEEDLEDESEELEEDDEILALLEDDEKVTTFLSTLLEKYRSNTFIHTAS